jgi:hypothetical protein
MLRTIFCEEDMEWTVHRSDLHDAPPETKMPGLMVYAVIHRARHELYL